jgi:hypothetical protein
MKLVIDILEDIYIFAVYVGFYYFVGYLLDVLK